MKVKKRKVKIKCVGKENALKRKEVEFHLLFIACSVEFINKRMIKIAIYDLSLLGQVPVHVTDS
jgi:hypothetical protein